MFETAFCKLGVYICYDRHFPEGWRALALGGADYIVNPSATHADLSRHLWELEQPAAAVANAVYIGAINRVGVEEPWNWGQFYGSSYVADPTGRIIAQASANRDELLVAELDLDLIQEMRDRWNFYASQNGLLVRTDRRFNRAPPPIAPWFKDVADCQISTRPVPPRQSPKAALFPIMTDAEPVAQGK